MKKKQPFIKQNCHCQQGQAGRHKSAEHAINVVWLYRFISTLSCSKCLLQIIKGSKLWVQLKKKEHQTFQTFQKSRSAIDDVTIQYLQVSHVLPQRLLIGPVMLCLTGKKIHIGWMEEKDLIYHWTNCLSSVATFQCWTDWHLDRCVWDVSDQMLGTPHFPSPSPPPSVCLAPTPTEQVLAFSGLSPTKGPVLDWSRSSPDWISSISL